MPDASQGCGSVPSGWTCVIKRFVGDVLFIPHKTFPRGATASFCKLTQKTDNIVDVYNKHFRGRGLMRGDNLRATTKQKKAVTRRIAAFPLYICLILLERPPLPANINFPCKAICMFPRRLPCNQLMVVLFMQRGWSVSSLFILFPLHLV